MTVGQGSFVYTDAIDGQTGVSAAFMNNVGDNLQLVANSINRAATFTVAASNSSTADKNVADYLCTGTNDDVTINSAITAAAGAQGGIVQLCAGTFSISNSIQIKQGVWLRGAGPLATIVKIANNVSATTNAIINNTGAAIQSVVISDMLVSGNKANNTQTTRCIYLTNVLYSTIDNVNVQNAKNGFGIWLDSNCGPVNIQRCTGYYCDQDNFQINGNRCEVVNCFSSGAGSGYSGFNIGGSYCVIANNNSAGNGYGIYVVGSNNTITGNAIDSNVTGGIYVSGTYNEITSNVCVSNQVLGGLYVATNANNNTLTGNTCVGNVQSQGLTVSANSVNIIGNTVTNNGAAGIWISGASNCNIIGNNVQSNGTYQNITYPNIQIDGNSTYNNVQSNTCRVGVNANKPNYGITTSPGSNYNFICNNDLHTGGQTGAILDNATGTVTTAGNRTT